MFSNKANKMLTVAYSARKDNKVVNDPAPASNGKTKQSRQ